MEKHYIYYHRRKVFALICSEFSANEDWLRTGAGEMFSKTPSGTMEQLKKEFDLDDFSFNLVYEYLKLAPATRRRKAPGPQLRFSFFPPF